MFILQLVYSSLSTSKATIFEFLQFLLTSSKFSKIFFSRKLDIDMMDVWSKFGEIDTFGDITFSRFIPSSNQYVIIYIFFNNSILSLYLITSQPDPEPTSFRAIKKPKVGLWEWVLFIYFLRFVFLKVLDMPY